MSFSKSRFYIYKVLEAGLLAKAVERFVATLGDKPARIGISVSQDLPDGGTAHRKFSSPSELATICDLKGQWILVDGWTSSNEFRSFNIKEDSGLIEVSASSDTPGNMQSILELLTKTLELKEASDEILAKNQSPSRREISERLAVLERIVLGPSRTLRCFLSYRFTPENEDPARRLRDFLTLLGIDVVTGNTYEPRPVSQKVIERLKDDLDFVVLLIGQDGESFWTRDEIAAAKQKMIPLVPIVEEGMNFSSGLYGDLEYITYSKGHIGDSFLKVLEAVKYVRQQRKTISSPPPETQ